MIIVLASSCAEVGFGDEALLSLRVSEAVAGTDEFSLKAGVKEEPQLGQKDACGARGLPQRGQMRVGTDCGVDGVV